MCYCRKEPALTVDCHAYTAVVDLLRYVGLLPGTVVNDESKGPSSKSFTESSDRKAILGIAKISVGSL